MKRWWTVAAYAIAMAWLEAATVYDLRVMTDRVIPYQANPLPMNDTLGRVELVREGATLVMLLAVGMLAGRAWRSRLGYSAIAFGLWDVFYYVFLKMICGWPSSPFDWDILFLLPLPWWGPVLAPVCIATLMIVWGTLVTQGRGRSDAAAWTANAICGGGIALGLYVFMADAIRVAPQGADAVRAVLPTAFNWWLFGLALTLMSAPIAQMLGRRGQP